MKRRKLLLVEEEEEEEDMKEWIRVNMEHQFKLTTFITSTLYVFLLIMHPFTHLMHASHSLVRILPRIHRPHQLTTLWQGISYCLLDEYYSSKNNIIIHFTSSGDSGHDLRIKSVTFSLQTCEHLNALHHLYLPHHLPSSSNISCI